MRRKIWFLGLLMAVMTLAPGTAHAARWQAPLTGPLKVLDPFAPGAVDWYPGHRGVDLAASAGTWVLAAGAGTVVFAGDLAGRGVVSISHGRLRTTYEPVTALVVVGEDVSPGEVIGRIAATGGHCRCLHWGLKSGDGYFDPMSLLRRIVLKPL